MLSNLPKFQSWEEAKQRLRPVSAWYRSPCCPSTLKITHKFHPVARGWRDVPGTLPPARVFVRPVGAHQGPLCTADLVHTASWGGQGGTQKRERGNSFVGLFPDLLSHGHNMWGQGLASIKGPPAQRSADLFGFAAFLEPGHLSNYCYSHCDHHWKYGRVSGWDHRPWGQMGLGSSPGATTYKLWDSEPWCPYW